MSARAQTGAAETLRRIHEAKARAELGSADAMLGSPVRVKGEGDPLGKVLLVKGRPGLADTAAGKALAGDDGEAARKALEALGFDPGSVWATCSRPGKGDSDAVARRLELVIEAVDPGLVLALDVEAATDLAAAAGLDALPAGTPCAARGRTLGAVGGLEASLADPAAKALVWRQMKAIAGGRETGEFRETRTGRPQAPRVQGPSSGRKG